MILSKILKLTQKELITELNNELFEQGYENILKTDDYIFAEGEIPIMLVAHMDTVHKTPVKDIFYDKKHDVMWSPQGIGGDDRCGVFAIMKIIESGLKPYVLFTTEEEKGGKGAEKFCEQYQYNLNEKLRYMIEIDRRGDKQAVFYKCGNQEFEDYVLSFGFTKQHGTFTDISVLSPCYDIASVNLSAGYYNEHSLQEHIKIEHLTNTINAVKSMLKDKENDKYFDYQEKKWKYEGKLYDDDSYYSSYDEKRWDMWQDWDALSDKQFEDKYNKKKPAKRADVWFL